MVQIFKSWFCKSHLSILGCVARLAHLAGAELAAFGTSTSRISPGDFMPPGSPAVQAISSPKSPRQQRGGCMFL